MKFEITSFVAAVVVYLVRLRVQYAGRTRPLYSESFLENRSRRFMADESTTSTQSEHQGGTVDESDSMRAGSMYSSSRHVTGFVRGCSRAV